MREELLTLPRVIDAVREGAPLVHCLTAAVSMGFVADALLAAGARPLMTETAGEAPALVRQADALLTNLGTLSTDGAAGIPATVDVARRQGLPWVLDPAAIGMAPVRTPLAHQLVAWHPTIVRGNASEVLVLARRAEGGRGADSSHTSLDAHDAALELATTHRTVIAMSGPVDVITNGQDTLRLHNGSRWLPQVTGTGCVLGALSAACAAVTTPWLASATATAWLTVASEDAAGRSRGPGSFRVELLDALASITGEEVLERLVCS